jgi:NAD(P)-dependent dehydrogenase (short-subunit alcohol dehydrogenase family)
MAYELAPQGITVVLVKPGPARTPIWESLGTVQQRLAQVITSPDMAELYEADFAAVRVYVVRVKGVVMHLWTCLRTQVVLPRVHLCHHGINARQVGDTCCFLTLY